MASTPAACSRKCHVSHSSTRRSSLVEPSRHLLLVEGGEVADQVGPAPLEQVVLGPLVPLLDDRPDQSLDVGGMGRGEAAGAASARSGSRSGAASGAWLPDRPPKGTTAV